MYNFDMLSKNKKSNGLELVRFLICGVVCALADYLVCQLFVLILGNNLSQVWVLILSTTAGFVVGVILNYLISTYWVFQNVEDDTKSKTLKFKALFLLFSFIAMASSVGSMYLCDVIVKAINNNAYSIVDTSIVDLIKQYGIGFLAQGIFWAYFISFCVKTLVGLVFNYFTRKYILYKAPKEA